MVSLAFSHSLSLLVRLIQNKSVYLASRKSCSSDEAWVGASPELLADYKEKTFTTVSLAGTKRPEENWSEKEYEEQKMVTDYRSEERRVGKEC